MKLLHKNFLTLFGIALLIGVIYLAFSRNTPSSHVPPIVKIKEVPADYLAAPPHFGPLVQRQTISVEFINNIASGTLDPAADIKTIRIGQDVILYDKAERTLPLGGSVTAINTEDNEITMTLPEDTVTEKLLDRVDIITLETSASKRLPLSVLQTDDNSEHYVWIAVKKDDEENKYQLRRQVINKGLSDHNYFEENGYVLKSDSLVILDPDTNIKTDVLYDIKITKLNAPLHNPIKQAWIDYELYRLAKSQEQLLEIAEACDNGTYKSPQSDEPTKGDASVPGGTINGSCGGGTGSCGGGNAVGGGSCGNLSADDPLYIFNSLLNMTADKARGL